MRRTIATVVLCASVGGFCFHAGRQYGEYRFNLDMLAEAGRQSQHTMEELARREAMREAILEAEIAKRLKERSIVSAEPTRAPVADH
jgi:hypothetical protein